jgi:4-hydroxybenzoate polyprenyltransferase
MAVLGQEPRSVLQSWISALRVHQWSKNLLIFVPLFLGHRAGDVGAVVQTALAFLTFNVVTSATYIVNDLADLSADRQHDTKRFRAFASGRLPAWQGVVASLAMLAVGFAAAAKLSLPFAGATAAYLVMTVAYSIQFKRIAMADVSIVAALFTMRIVAGIVLLDLPMSPWMLSFSAFFFFSLALAKRHGELMSAKAGGKEEIPGRGWRASDWPLTLALGLATGAASIVIMLLFVWQEAAVTGAYHRPDWLYVEPAVVSLWLQRVWLLSNRTELSDDPVVFALKDKLSYALGAIAAVALMVAL